MVLVIIGWLVEAITVELRAAGDTDLKRELEECLGGIRSLEDPRIRRDPAAVRRRMRRLNCAAEDMQSILGRRRASVIALHESVDYLSATMTLSPVRSFLERVESILQNERVSRSDPMCQTLQDLSLKITRLLGQERASGARPFRRSASDNLSTLGCRDGSYGNGGR
jgi:hypothetical protein